jgi:hypothetical protein
MADRSRTDVAQCLYCISGPVEKEDEGEEEEGEEDEYPQIQSSNCECTGRCTCYCTEFADVPWPGLESAVTAQLLIN